MSSSSCIKNVYTLYMLQRFQIPTKWLLSCALVCTLEIVFCNVLLYCCAVLCDESHNIFTLNIEINKSIQVNTPTRSLLMLTLHLPFRNVICPAYSKYAPNEKFCGQAANFCNPGQYPYSGVCYELTKHAVYYIVLNEIFKMYLQ